METSIALKLTGTARSLYLRAYSIPLMHWQGVDHCPFPAFFAAAHQVQDRRQDSALRQIERKKADRWGHGRSIGDAAERPGYKYRSVVCFATCRIVREPHSRVNQALQYRVAFPV